MVAAQSTAWFRLMDARLTFITLAVADVAASRRFYVDSLGWRLAFESPGEVMFFRVAPTVMRRSRARRNSRRRSGRRRPVRGCLPSRSRKHARSSRRRWSPRSDCPMQERSRLGAGRDWGGYSGYFSDPDGFRWEIAFNPGPIGVDLLKTAGIS